MEQILSLCVGSINYEGGIFPVVNYFNAFDLIICGASYNSFWEAIYLKKKLYLYPTRLCLKAECSVLMSVKDTLLNKTVPINW